jgi:hypothetical protein
MSNLVAIDLREPSAIDTDAIQVLKKDVGERRCRSIIDSIIFEITDILCRVETSVKTDDVAALKSDLTRLAELSARAGLVCIADIATDLSACVDSADFAGTAAVSARLIRVGEDSLFALIEYTDQLIV